ncbi:MAG: ABC transporter permease [Dysgonamonadaceae bacterium]|nr:ABC transporter permease [Dysgonamonadaceae bacterium]
MIKQYLIQAWRLLKENPLLSFISIIGTALAICMIMVMVMSHEVKNAPFPPESNRDRMMYVQFASSRQKDGSSQSGSSGGLAYELAKEGFKELETPETVSIATIFEPSALASIQANKKATSVSIKLTDAEFWEIFDLSIITGKPYTKADVDAGLRKVVLTEKIARKVFGTIDVIGKTLLLNYTDYTVCGVVKDVSYLFTNVYSHVWAPLTSQDINISDDLIVGSYQVFILAESRNDFPTIREEAEKLRKQYNAGLPDLNAHYMGQPDEHYVAIKRHSSNVGPDIKSINRQFIIVIALLLIVPAINLSSMTGSRMRKRMSELGVRRAFGATQSNVFTQVIWESLLQTIIGGILGLILSVIAAYVLKGLIFHGAVVELSLLLKPVVFLYALLFCLLLNLLSAIIPAWRASRNSIVNSILLK